jgi:hypothetical protein
VTAEAGHRVGLSAGARVVHVAAGPMGDDDLDALLAARPDVVLLVGGTDGGNAEILRHNAGVIAARRLTVPVVLAGNVDARDDVAAALLPAGVPVTATANVLPEIGRLDPVPCAAGDPRGLHQARHRWQGPVQRADFPAMVRAATPDAVLAGVELLADGHGETVGAGDVLVVDVGGATTDVYSVVTPQGEDAVLRKEVVEVMWRSRTVEGDLGVRWNAEGVVTAAVAERLVRGGRGDVVAYGGTGAGRGPGVPACRRPGPRRRRPAGRACAHPWRCGGMREVGRTCARWYSWSAPAGCSGTPPQDGRPLRWRRPPATSAAAGQSRKVPGRWWTPATCSPLPGCSRTTTPRWAQPCCQERCSAADRGRTGAQAGRDCPPLVRPVDHGGVRPVLEDPGQPEQERRRCRRHPASTTVPGGSSGGS